jgi:hypothetical protein
MEEEGGCSASKPFPEVKFPEVKLNNERSAGMK